MISTNATPADELTADQLEDLSAVELLILWTEIDHEGDQHPSVVPLGQLLTAPRVFLTRDPAETAWDQREQICSLAKIVQQGDPFASLGPLTVLPLGSLGYVVVDGHMRLEAYRRAGLKPSQRVPVVVATGSPAEAMGDALRSRTKTHLPMTPAEKQEAAWRLVLMNSAKRIHTQAEIAECTGTSIRSVKRMKKELKAAEAEVATTGVDPQDATWKKVLCRSRPAPERDDDVEGWREKQAAEMARRMRKALGQLPHTDPELFTDAIEKLMGRRTARVATSLIHRVPADELAAHLIDRYGLSTELVARVDDF